jgi:hypothetical protein
MVPRKALPLDRASSRSARGAPIVRALVWVFDGTFRGPPPSDKVPLPYSGVVERRSERRKIK